MSKSEFYNVQTCLFFLVELSKDSFSIGLHQQVFAVYTEVHHPRCSSRHSLFTEALWHLAVSISRQKISEFVTIKWKTIALVFIVFRPTMALLEMVFFLFCLPGFYVQKTQIWFNWNLCWLDSLCQWNVYLQTLRQRREMVSTGGSSDSMQLKHKCIHFFCIKAKNAFLTL